MQARESYTLVLLKVGFLNVEEGEALLRLGDNLTESYCCDNLLMPLQCPMRSPAAPIGMVDLELEESAGGRPLLRKSTLLFFQRSLLSSACAAYSAALPYMELWQLEKDAVKIGSQ